MVFSHPMRFDPDRKLSRACHALHRVSCTRSSARSLLRHSENEYAPRAGINATSAVLNSWSGLTLLRLRFFCLAVSIATRAPGTTPLAFSQGEANDVPAEPVIEAICVLLLMLFYRWPSIVNMNKATEPWSVSKSSVPKDRGFREGALRLLEAADPPARAPPSAKSGD